MKLAIRRVVLYPKDRELKPRLLKFEDGMINVITGHSQKGKSAIIHIIDYCLGSKECHIPIGDIRDKVDKFAIEIILDDKMMFIARDNPDEAKTNIYYEIYSNESARTFQLDRWIEEAYKFKTNREDLKTYLGELAGFENINESIGTSNSGFDAPASFRDTAAFTFQPQNIIANPTTIFYKTDTFEHLARLKTLFPLVLGYKSYEIIRLEKEIEIKEKELNDKQRRLEEIQRQYESWQSDTFQYYSRAINLGLTNVDIDISTSTVAILKDELARIVASIKSRNYLQAGAAIRYSEKLQELEVSRQQLMRELDDAKVELRKIEQFDRSKEEYLSQVTAEVANRLKPVEWFLQQKGVDTCPFCNSQSDKAVDELLSLQEYRVQNDIILDNKISREFSFEREKAIYKSIIKEREKTIKNIDINIAILENENREYYQRYQDIFEFSGKIETVIDNLNKILPSGQLTTDIQKLVIEISVTKSKLIRLQEKFDKDACLQRVTNTIDKYIKVLPIEGRDFHRVRLDPDKSVSIRVENTKSKDVVFLSRIGSGANHMCYHIATILGLHEYFQNLTKTGKINYVPSFIVLDQPSQVYFPKYFPDVQESKETTSKEVGEGNQQQEKEDEDIKNTTAIFKTCSKFIEATEHKTQVIILEHAPEQTWKNIDHVHLVEEWRSYEEEGISKFNALIPMDWFA